MQEEEQSEYSKIEMTSPLTDCHCITFNASYENLGVHQDHEIIIFVDQFLYYHHQLSAENVQRK